MASAALHAREAQERLARANFLPDLGLVFRFGYAVSSAADAEMSQLYYQDNFNYSRVTAALALRWKWDFHNRVFDLQAARATRRAAEYQREGARLLLGRDVEQAYADVVDATHEMASSRQAVQLSWKLVVSGQQKDTVGGGDAEQLLRSLEKWYRTRFEQVEAIGARNDAVARLSRAVGTPLAISP
jgi:outer membrane protein TolC